MRHEVRFTHQFKRDLKLAKKQDKDLDKLYEVIEQLANGETLDARYCNLWSTSFHQCSLQFEDLIRTIDIIIILWYYLLDIKIINVMDWN